MKNQHTPGPWRVVCASAHEFNPNTTRKDIIGKNLFGDAYVAGDIAANDAALISAAPDLLSALKALHSCHRAFSGSESWTTLDDEARGFAETAIAKAEGVK